MKWFHGVSRACGTPHQSRLDTGLQKKGPAPCQWWGLAVKLCGREEARLERNFAVIHPSRRLPKARHRRSSPACAVAVRLIEKLDSHPGPIIGEPVAVPPSLRHLRVVQRCPDVDQAALLRVLLIISTKPSWKVTMRCHSVRSTLSPEFLSR